jgi:cob(I)alamin adenosyltransferase
LKNVQRLLFCLGAELACRAPASRIQTAHVEEIDTMLEGFNAQLQPLTRFILPGGSELASRLHLARAICRRAERDLAAYKQEEPDPVSPHALALMNRLSDLLFALARLANKRAGSAEEKWDAEQEREPPAK